MGYYDGMIATWEDQAGAPKVPTNKLLGHQTDFRRDPLAFMLQARHECGDFIRLRFGPFRFHLLSDPAEAYAVLVEKHKSYSKRTPGYDMLRTVLGEGLVTSEGQLWRRQRRIAQPAFHRSQVEGLIEVMRRASVDRVLAWESAAREGTTIDVAHEMSTLTLRIAGETMFGIDLSDEQEEVSSALNGMMQGFARLMGTPFPILTTIPTPANLRMKRAITELDRVVHQMIAERRENPSDDLSLLRMFMEARDEDGQGMSNKQLRDESLTMLLAGHETTANALSWTFYLLSKHPDVSRRLEAELDEVLGGEAPSVAQVSHLPYTTQVIKESMRLFPPVWTVGRRAEEEDEICGYRVPKGALVLMSPHVLHRHPEVWDNPEGFDPDRFEAGRPPPPRGAYMPFIAGPRKCIGEHFAMSEAVMVLATLLARYRLELVPGHKVEADPNVTLRPKTGIQMRVRRR